MYAASFHAITEGSMTPKQLTIERFPKDWDSPLENTFTIFNIIIAITLLIITRLVKDFDEPYKHLQQNTLCEVYN